MLQSSVAATGAMDPTAYATSGIQIRRLRRNIISRDSEERTDMKPAGCACIDSVTATYFRSDGGDKF